MAIEQLLRTKLRAPCVLFKLGLLVCQLGWGTTLFSKPPELFQLQSNSKPAIAKNGKFLPSRVYKVFLANDSTTRFAVTDDQGNFEKPYRILRKRTVLSGKLLGGNGNDNFALKPDGKWKKSNWPLVQIFEILEKPARLQVIYHKPATESQTRSVASIDENLKGPIIRTCTTETNDCSKEVNLPLLPRHLYYVSMERDRWHYLVTDSYGRFSTPTELLQEGSIIPGPWLGDIFEYSRYQILANGQWKKMADIYEKQTYLVLSKPAQIKTVSYDLNLGKR